MTDENPRRLTPDPKSELADLESQWDVRLAVLRVG
jgi:hypothetical protein